ncbi:pitrilysin family protein [Tabrizicola sp.]|jgi:zinc protease|uniref:M16 family metallopeptidase n=1 Tax=Tabrizicola sp. TaxID=2005166 RepID=UPI0025E028C7|nr:pitrilysin family protein [Tabrizicola sp.]MBY0350633.1 insulinase family protein [Tabrizicola sp.]MDK2773550.1 insulinase family protein [Tabrizicola sp.]
MLGRIGAGVAALVALALPAAAKDPVTTFTLDNGLQVVVIEDNRAPVVVQMIWYRVGAADEPPGNSGIAHFLEHLMFKGTEKVAPNAFSGIVEAQGGDDNAFTSWDYTAYFQRIAADRLELVMQMEADRMRNLRLAEEDVATERQVILEERAQRTDSNPDALLSEQMRAAQFQNSRYGIPVIGWRNEIEALSREDALSYYKRFYAPNNATLIIAGDVKPEAAKALAEKYYGPIAPSDGIVPRDRPQEPKQLSERRLQLADERVSEPYVMRTYLAPERDPGDQKQAAALTVLAELLGGNGQTSVLARALQFDRQVAVYSSAFYDGTSIDDGTFGIAVVPAPGVSLATIEADLDRVLAKFLADGPDPAALERIRTQVRAGEIFARDSVENLAQRYGQGLSVGLTVADIEGWDEALAAVTEADVMQAARLVLDRKNAVTGWLTRPAQAGEAQQ